MAGWIGVDLDGTLAEYGGWQGADHIGKPIPLMVNRVKQWIREDREVRIMTARVAPMNCEGPETIKAIDDWVRRHIGMSLPITHEKDFGMIELWDDRVVQVIVNTGRRADGKD